jgi:hypothetical protein
MNSSRALPLALAGTASLTLALSPTGCSLGSSAGGSAGSTAGTAAGSTTGATSGASTAANFGAGSTAELDACTLVSAADAATLTGYPLTDATPSTIADGQDQCVYADSSGAGVTVIVYQQDSGVTLAMLKDISGGSDIQGIGDKASVGGIELDVQAGTHLIAVQGGLDIATSGPPLAKALIAALH